MATAVDQTADYTAMPTHASTVMPRGKREMPGSCTGAAAAPRRRRAGQREVELGLAPADRVGQCAARAARHRPAERAVPGVEPQVAVARGTDQRHVRRRGGPQARPELRTRRIAAIGEQLEAASLQRRAAHVVERRRVAGQLGRAGDAQPVAEAREHDLPREIGQRHDGRAAMLADVDGHRVTLGRIDEARHADRRQQEWAVAAERDDDRVGTQHFAATLRRNAHAFDAIAARVERFDRRRIAELHAARRGELRQLDCERVCVARFVGGGENAAGELPARRRERGLDRDAFVGRAHDAVAAELAHQRRGLDTVLEFLGIGVELQDAALEMVVRDAGLGAQRLQAVPRVKREVEALDRVVLRTRRQAFDEELHPPFPLPPVGAQPEQQRRILAAQPLEDLERRLGIRPGLGIRRGDLSAVGERSLEPGGWLAVDDGDVMAVGGEIPRRGDADDAAAQHEHPHQRASPLSATGMQLQNRLRSP
jgi:hypothetical protein